MKGLEDVPELMQHIQLLLPAKEAARTSVLSKSWLHAWSTIPTLRFYFPDEQERKQLKLDYIDRTLTRYLRDNIPIERFDLKLLLENGESASLAEKWIRSVGTKTCLKTFFLATKVRGASLDLPDEILSSESLTSIRVSSPRGRYSVWMRTSPSHHHPRVINCVSLRELHLSGVRISQQLLDHILSSCRLLAKIKLDFCARDLKTITVKSLPCLDELEIATGDTQSSPNVEISNVPNLRLFTCNLRPFTAGSLPFTRFYDITHSISLGSSVTQLSLGGPGLVTDNDNAFLDVLKSGLPFLECLTLDMTFWTLRTFHFTCASIKTLLLGRWPVTLIDIQVNAQKLLYFHLHDGNTMPSLSFPISATLEEITFRLKPLTSFGASFLINLREALELSSTCYIQVANSSRSLASPWDIDQLLVNLKTRLQLPPAMNVQTLSFETLDDEDRWRTSPFFNAYIEICHPKQVIVKPDSFKLMLEEVLEKKTTTTATANWPHYLKHVQIRRPGERWEALTNFPPIFMHGSRPTYADFKLDWFKC